MTNEATPPAPSSPSETSRRPVAVTGGTGHVGGALIRALDAQGFAVRALMRRSSDEGSLLGARYERVEADLASTEALTEAFRGCDTVFHVAGMVSISEAHERELQRTNVDGTRHVIEACERAGVRRLVYTSSVHALTEPAGRGAILDESMGFDALLAHGAYGRSKAAASSMVQLAAREGRVDAVLVLPSGCVGPYDYRPSPQGRMIMMLGRGLMPLTVAGGYHWVDVRDVAQGSIQAMQRGRTGEAYLLDGGYLSAMDLGRAVARRARTMAPLAGIPHKIVAAFAALGPVFERVTGREALLTPYSLHTLAAEYVVSAEKAKSELGFAPRSPAESFGDAWTWLREDPSSPMNRPRNKRV
jgi:dihydroflavonol-4-reductase